MKRKTARFPTPWQVCENHDCFVIEDATGRVLYRVRFGLEGGQVAAGLMSKVEAREIADGMAKATDILMPAPLG